MNASKMKTPVRVAFFGDSITFGLCDEKNNGWPARLARLSASTGNPISAYNLGVRGDTSDLILARWKSEAAARLPQPERSVIVFSFGLNDATMRGEALRVPVERSLANAETMIGDARKDYRVLWVGPTPINEDQQPSSNSLNIAQRKSNRETRAYNKAYADLAQKLGVIYVDLFAVLSRDAQWYAKLHDGVHPNADGYSTIAAQIHDHAGWIDTITI